MLEELDNHAILLLHLAGELPNADAAALQKRLSTDPMLRQQFDALSAAQQEFEESMARVDAAPLPAESVLTRRIGVAIRRRLAEHAVKAPDDAQAASRSHRYPWWAYTAASAAIVLLGVVSWWGHRPSTPLALPPVSPPSPIVRVSPAEAMQFTQSIMGDVNEETDPAHARAVATLNDAQRQLADLKNSRVEADSYFGVSDASE